MSERKARAMTTLTPPATDLTGLLHQWRGGSETAFSHLIERAYDELKLIAARRLGRSGARATFSPTELLHEALIGIMPTQINFRDRVHFFATMSLVIRSILVDRARSCAGAKHGGDRLRVTLTNDRLGEDSMVSDLLAIDQALTQLEAQDARCGQVMHLTFFAGLSSEEIAATLDVSAATVRRDLSYARLWIARALAGET